MKQLLDTIKKPSWAIRRRLINAVLVFCAAEVLIVTVAMFGFLDVGMVALAQTIVISAFALASTTLGSYIFGAAWDDKNHRGRNWRDWDDRHDRHDDLDNSEEPG